MHSGAGWPTRTSASHTACDTPMVDGVQIFTRTPHVQELIKKGDVIGVKEALVRSAEKGMQSFDVSLYQLYLDGKITLEEAIGNADSRSNLEAKINFG